MSFRFQKAAVNELSYPITMDDITANSESLLVSMTLSNDPHVIVSPEEMPVPFMPEDDEFWTELIEVAWRRSRPQDRMRFTTGSIDWQKMFPLYTKENPLTPVFGNQVATTPARLAEIVHNEWPTKIPMLLIEHLYKTSVLSQSNVIPHRTRAEFTMGDVLCSCLFGEGILNASPSAFASKYYFGRPRPEEAVAAYVNETFPVPEEARLTLGNLINDKAIQSNPKSFTAYPEGSPNHPSYCAMHGAAAGYTPILAVLFDLTDFQLEICKKTAFVHAVARDMAGVHYMSDSMAGLWLGEEVIERWLPDHLVQYGASATEVRERVRAARTDWLQYATFKSIPGAQNVSAKSKKVSKRRVATPSPASDDGEIDVEQETDSKSD